MNMELYKKKIVVDKVLAHLSWKLQWAFLIAICPSVRLSVCLSVTFHIFIFFSRTTWLISTKLSTKHPWVMGIQVCSKEGLRPFPRGGNKEIRKIQWQILKIFFLRTTGPISTELGTQQPWVMGIQVYTNEGPSSFSRGVITK